VTRRWPCVYDNNTQGTKCRTCRNETCSLGKPQFQRPKVYKPKLRPVYEEEEENGKEADEADIEEDDQLMELDEDQDICPPDEPLSDGEDSSGVPERSVSSIVDQDPEEPTSPGGSLKSEDEYEDNSPCNYLGGMMDKAETAWGYVRAPGRGHNFRQYLDLIPLDCPLSDVLVMSDSSDQSD